MNRFGLWSYCCHWLTPTCHSPLICCQPVPKVYNTLPSIISGDFMLIKLQVMFSWLWLWIYLFICMQSVPVIFVPIVIPITREVHASKQVFQCALRGILSFTRPTASKYYVVEYICQIHHLPQSMLGILPPYRQQTSWKRRIETEFTGSFRDLGLNPWWPMTCTM